MIIYINLPHTICSNLNSYLKLVVWCWFWYYQILIFFPSILISSPTSALCYYAWTEVKYLRILEKFLFLDLCNLFTSDSYNSIDLFIWCKSAQLNTLIRKNRAGTGCQSSVLWKLTNPAKKVLFGIWLRPSFLRTQFLSIRIQTCVFISTRRNPCSTRRNSAGIGIRVGTYPTFPFASR